MMREADTAATVTVETRKLVELAIEQWRLERWIAQSELGASGAPARYAIRRIGEFLKQQGVETVDLTGQRYEPGLALEVLGTVAQTNLSQEATLIHETVAPICLVHGKVVQHGQVIIAKCASGDIS